MSHQTIKTPSAPEANEFVAGFKDSIPIIFAVSPFGALFGAAAIAAGLTPSEAILSSMVMFAGASQFVFIEVNGLDVPAWSVVLAVFAVNFRMILYSASLGRKMTAFSTLQKYFSFLLLTDPAWAASEARHDSQGLRPAYFMGYAIPLYLLWIGVTAHGVSFGRLIDDPVKFGFDFLLPVYFLTILMGFRKRPRWLPIVLVSGIASVLIYKFVGPPWHISLGALIGVGVAAMLPVPNRHNEPVKVIVQESSDD